MSRAALNGPDRRGGTAKPSESERMNLYTASNQWAERPEDERFWNLADLLKACKAHKESAREYAHVPTNTMRVETTATGDLHLVGRGGQATQFTHWSFGQMARLGGAPADYLRGLPCGLAAANLNHCIQKRGAAESNLLVHQNGGLVLRSVTTDQYTRIWNADVVSRLVGFEDYGWRVPPARPARGGQAGSRPATEKDVLASKEGGGGLSVRVGDMIAPAGLYASDHDLFVFLVNEGRRIQDGTEEGLSRGFFARNTEVGDGALKVTTFLYRHVCGNHIVWGASGVREIKIVHRGGANERFVRQLQAEVREYAEGAASDDEVKIVRAQSFKLGNDKEAVLDALFKTLRGEMSQKAIESSYDRAELTAASGDRTIDPNTAWGWVQGATNYSQTIPYADERNRIDRAAGKVMAMAF